MGTTQNFEKLMAYVSTYIGESSIYVRLSEKISSRVLWAAFYGTASHIFRSRLSLMQVQGL